VNPFENELCSIGGVDYVNLKRVDDYNIVIVGRYTPLITNEPKQNTLFQVGGKKYKVVFLKKYSNEVNKIVSFLKERTNEQC